MNPDELTPSLSVCAGCFRQTRKDYITAKYTEKRFAERICDNAASRLRLLYEAVRDRDILSLIQVYAEGVDLMEASKQPNEHVRLHSDPVPE